MFRLTTVFLNKTVLSVSGWEAPNLHRTCGSVGRGTNSRGLPMGADGTTVGMGSLDRSGDELVAAIESLADLPGWRALLVATAGAIAMSSIPEIAQSDTLDDYIAHYARHDLEPAAQAVRVHRPAHFLHIEIGRAHV